MEKVKLQKLNSTHDSTLIQCQKNSTKGSLKGELSKQYEIEEEFREISSDDSSVLIIDRWTPL
ncbi:MAG: hypothetical protein WBL21_06340, partial [Salinimicrobium sp.]